MKVITLKRISTNIDGTYGVLLDGNVPFAVTVEPEDKNNAVGISCIPPWSYECFIRKSETSKRNYDVIELKDVPERTVIQMHIGVTEDSSEGCVIVGEWFEPYGKKTAGVMQSTKGFGELMDRVKGEETFILKIMKCY